MVVIAQSIRRNVAMPRGKRQGRGRRAVANVDVNSAGFKIFQKKCFFYEEGNAFKIFVRPRGCTHYVLFRNTEWKHPTSNSQTHH